MVNTRGDRLISLLLKFGRAVIESEDPTEAPKDLKSSPKATTEPMMVFWEKDKEAFKNRNQEYIDLFQKGLGSTRIPDSTESPVKESGYNFNKIPSYGYLQEALNVKGKVLDLFILLKNIKAHAIT